MSSQTALIVSIAGLSLCAALVACSNKAELPNSVEIVPVNSADRVSIREQSNYTVFGTSETAETLIQFQSPDSWFIEDAFSGTIVLVNDEAWRRVDEGWTAIDADEIRAGILSSALRIGQVAASDFETQRAGPSHGDEQTVVLAGDVPEFGSFMEGVAETGDFPPDIQALVQEMFSDSSARIELTVGTDSGRIYDAKFYQDGPNLSAETHITFDYDSPVSIPEPR